jgi:hypothetical protein
MKIIDILKNKRHMILPYTIKYSKLTFRYCLYFMFKRLSIRQFDRHKTKVLKAFCHSDSSGFKETLSKSIVKSLIEVDFLNESKYYINNTKIMGHLKKESDLFIEKRFLVLGEHLEKEDVYDNKRNTYKWNYDFKSKYYYKLSHYSKVRKVNKREGIDIKNVWELSRMQYLFAPALYWKLTKDDKYVKMVVEVMRDWILNNRYSEGPNWNISMEVGIRITNMLLAFQLIFDSKFVDDDFSSLFLTSVYEHLTFIVKNEENIGSKTSNHYLGGLLGLTSIVTTFSTLDKNSLILEYVRKSSLNEIQKQILDDGTDFEGSTSYQRLVGEMFSYIAIMLSRRKVKVDKIYKDKLQKMAVYSLSILKPNNEIVQIGDNDGGRIFLLGKEDNLDHRGFINLAFFVSMGNYFTNHHIEKNMIFTGPNNFLVNYACDKIKIFPDSKVAIIRKLDFYFLISAIDVHKYGMGGHTHNDKLSIELFYKGKNFIVDPGTAIYTGNPSLRNRMRSVNLHSTAVVNGSEQNRFKDGLFDLMYDCKTTLRLKEQADEILIEGSNEISHGNNKIIHKRVVNIKNSEVLILDQILGNLKTVKINLILHPDLIVEEKENEICLNNGGESISIMTENMVEIKRATYSREYGHWVDSILLEFKPKIENEKKVNSEILIKFK